MSEPWVLYEDEHLLAVHKPAGVRSHTSDAHGQHGIYEWVASQRPEATLALLHRLDKGTSGVLVFGKTPLANRSLEEQLRTRTLKKTYQLLTRYDRTRPRSLTCDYRIRQKRKGEYRDREAVTDYALEEHTDALARYRATPHTGRTHQVRLHAVRLGFPLFGDVEYEGPAGARLFLHAERLTLAHPASGAKLKLHAPLPKSFRAVLEGGEPAAPAIAARAARESREVLFDPSQTSAYLWIDRHHDGFPDLRVERYGDVGRVLRYDEREAPLPQAWVEALMQEGDLRALVEQQRPRGGGAQGASVIAGELPEARFQVSELGLRYWVDLEASPTSSGLFLDQRETRRRLLGSDLAGLSVLNAFGHTGSLSVAAAKAGAETLTLDLSKRYLEWARENLALNGLDPQEHDFIYGDALDWLRRLANKKRKFDVVLLDPPSSSTSGKGRNKRRWIVERDLAELTERGARLLAKGGLLFVSTNLRRMAWPRFLEQLAAGLSAAGRTGKVTTQTVPLDYRTGAGDPPYLKAAWVRVT
ncbi:MAG: class I SAM-dependent methyltransferase [Planctomycetes bacterium]|nr:class I SAM-dependent methyltransferase [Planctomycetota bacterium]